MDSLVIKGPVKLSGSVEVSGSKNTALPLLFTSLLFDDVVKFSNVPRLWDIETTLKLLSLMGSESQWDKDMGTISVRPRITKAEAPYEWVKKMRAGILALGPLLAKKGEARVSLPGGCAIGARPVNYHIDALRKMGVTIDVAEGYINAKVKDRLHGADVTFPDITVTGTENLMIVAACAEGKTWLRNSACEPEVVALGEMLRSCGARINGLGTPLIEIEGTKLHAPAAAVEIPPDRIEAGTWIAASVVTKSALTIKKIDASKMESVIAAYRQMGVRLEIDVTGTEMHVQPPEKLLPLNIETQPYPGFPTDMQAQLLVSACFAHGKSRVRESIFENRFMHVAELQRLGAKIKVEGSVAEVEGPCELTGAPIMATDLRASASLVIAALAAQGETKISRIYHLDRGYQRLDKKLQSLGVSVTRLPE